MSLITDNINVAYRIKRRQNKGNIVYEYNPLYNLRATVDQIDPITGEHYKTGQLIPFRTKRLGFDIMHPVNIETQTSYDGSVNLILNDDKNIPRLINTRFSPRGKHTYEIVDRVGNNDTNIYDDDNSQFDIDTSLYKKVETIPNITFDKVINSGELKVGNYIFYFKYSDADDNETDFVGESSIVSIFKGNDCDPFSIDGGERDMNAHKSIQFTISNIDQSYDYVKVYYTRSSAEHLANRITQAYSINKKYTVRSGQCKIIINGTEVGKTIPLSDINTQYFVADSVGTEAQCQNMLFMANITKLTVNYKELTDLSVRIFPYIHKETARQFIGYISPENYSDNSTAINRYEYYNTQNIYNRVGYWPEEIYRLGIVYIMNNGTLSPVFNVRGNNNIDINPSNFSDSKYNDAKDLYDINGKRKYLVIDQTDYTLGSGSSNAKGVIRFTDSDNTMNYVYGIGFYISDEVKNELIKLGIKGYFFVRQKRIPTILAQAFTIGLDQIAHIPLIPYNNKYLAERFIDNGGYLDATYQQRLYEEDSVNKNKIAAICPEFMYNQQYYNQFFTGTQYPIKACAYSSELERTSYDDRLYYTPDIQKISDNYRDAKIVSVTDEVPSVAIEDTIFKSQVGDSASAYKTSYLKINDIESSTIKGYKNPIDIVRGESSTIPINIVRGIYSPYLGIVTTQNQPLLRLINIYQSGYSENKMQEYFSIRYEDSSAYRAISQRYTIEDNSEKIEYRGDSYLCTFTWRVNRNFQDPVSPTNEIIIDKDCWRNNYDTKDTTKLEKINLGDVDAVKLGSWITFKFRSSTNLSIRSADYSNVTEVGINGIPRSFYPLSQLTVQGNNKIPQSYLMNDGFRTTLGERYNYTLPDVPYIKNVFHNRVLYSDIAINDAYRNGYRIFRDGDYSDYSSEYGQIIKLIEWQGDLLCVFEHGIAKIPVNEKAIIQNQQGGTVAIQADKVIPDELDGNYIITNMYGSQWADSIIKTPYFIYGIDTVAKKIWQISSTYSLKIISDLKVNKFLVDNIKLGERDNQPIIGIKNVKSHYNANKGDIMFTFYCPKEGNDEYAWNLCYNEIIEKFTTFYSWIPESSANIDNIMFTYDRETSKNIAMLNIDKIGNKYSLSKIKLSKHILDSDTTEILGFESPYIPVESNRYELQYTYSLPKYKGDNDLFTLTNNVIKLISDNNSSLYRVFIDVSVKAVYNSNLDLDGAVKNYLSKYNPEDNNTVDCGTYHCVVYLMKKDIYDQYSTWLWKHGTAGIFNQQDDIIKPTNWYGTQHPFEFEFVVRDTPNISKIFDNLEIISNKAEPESFHFEVVGESYDFSKDKPNMYYRQEATKQLLNNLGSHISYNSNFTKVNVKQLTKSSIFPLYYNRIDVTNQIYDNYTMMVDPDKNKDYSNLSGSEIKWNRDLNEFSILTHIKNQPINKYGRMRGNSHYKEDRWKVQIPSITFMQKNEKQWDKPPIIISKNGLPSDIKQTKITTSELPNTYNIGQVKVDSWTYRKETRLRDKYIRIRIRYSGKELAIISGILTTYTESYA